MKLSIAFVVLAGLLANTAVVTAQSDCFINNVGTTDHAICGNQNSPDCQNVDVGGTACGGVECVGDDVCFGADITADLVKCTASASCDRAAITINPGGSLLCSGNWACKRFDIRPINARGATIICENGASGQEACKFFTASDEFENQVTADCVACDTFTNGCEDDCSYRDSTNGNAFTQCKEYDSNANENPEDVCPVPTSSPTTSPTASPKLGKEGKGRRGKGGKGKGGREKGGKGYSYGKKGGRGGKKRHNKRGYGGKGGWWTSDWGWT